ncbi:60S ribosomal protein L8, partial [Coemansia sp. RSA 1285]
MAPQKTAKRKVAALPYNVRNTKAGKDKTTEPLFERRPRSFGIGQDIQPRADLTRFVKWPKY